MIYKQAVLPQKKSIALVAHDNKKQELLDWASLHKKELIQHELFATGTTGTLLEKHLNVKIHKLKSGPLGGDQQIGAKITERKIHCVIFFWDPLEAQPHDPDVKALLRLAVVWNIPLACNRISADFIFSSEMIKRECAHTIPDFHEYQKRRVPTS